MEQELNKLYELRKHHMDCLSNWIGGQALTRAGMCADLAIIESKIELLEKYST